MNKFPTVNVENFLSKKGIEFSVANDNWLKMRCPFPDHNDKNPSFYIHRKHGGYNCYSQCGTGSWTKFLEKMGWLREVLSSSEILIDVIPNIIWDEIKEVTEESKFHYKAPKPNYELINKKKHKLHYSYLKKRNLLKVFEHYPIYACTQQDRIYRSKYLNRILIPVHDDKGKFLWFEGRYIGDAKKLKYYRPPIVKAKEVLFNYHRIKKSKYVIVFEGILDPMVVYTYNMSGVCSFNPVLSDEQISLLTNFDKIYLCQDNDDAGIKGYLKNVKKLKGLGHEIYRIVMPKKKDVLEISQKHFIKLFNQARIIR